MKKQENKRGEAGERPWLRATLAALRGGLLACGAAVLLLLAAACLISTGAVGERWLDGVVPGACVAGSLVGGLYAVGRAGRPALAVGLGTGITLFLLLCLPFGKGPLALVTFKIALHIREQTAGNRL